MTNINYKIFSPKVIICIVGPSGSGKTTIANLMNENGIPTIVSYTTRPMREGEVNGREHWFVSPGQIPPQSEMMAYTKFNGYDYWTKISQFSHKICTYVIDEKGIEYFKRKWKDKYVLFFLYIDRPETERVESGVEKERLDRDKERDIIPLEKYDYIIHNTYSISELKRRIRNFTNELVKYQ